MPFAGDAASRRVPTARSDQARQQRCMGLDVTCSHHLAARYPSPMETAYHSQVSSAHPNADATNFVSGEAAMKAAILLYGAVAGGFALYSDFIRYRSGVYQAQQVDEFKRLGTHIVQIIGWGVTKVPKAKYWIAENSWGQNWGENQNFQPCSSLSCRGRFCQAADNLNPSCADNQLWRDAFGNGCAWYLSNDPGCEVFPEVGQLAKCPRACRSCAPPPLRSGEVCGYFRILRGSNHLGIETSAAHTYVAGQAPLESLLRSLAPTCEDDPNWKDAWGSNCQWYSIGDPGCIKFQNYGQLAFCPKTCGTCPADAAQRRPPVSLDEDASASAAAPAAAHPYTVALIALVAMGAAHFFLSASSV